MNRWGIIFLTIVTFFVGDRLGAYVLERLLYRSPQRFPSMYEGNFDADVVCIGNSRGLYGFDLELVKERTGRPIVNLSHNGMTPRIARAIFADYLAHNRKPKTLIVELSFLTSQTSSATVLDYKPFWNRSKRLRELGEMFSSDSIIACSLLHLYRYNSEMYFRAIYYWLRGKSDQNGFMNFQITSDLIAETEELQPFRLQIDSEELAALKELIQTARESGVTVRPVLAPYFPAYANRITNLDDFLAEFTRATGLGAIDCSRENQSSHFADRVHMNRSGAQDFTKSLIQQGAFD